MADRYGCCCLDSFPCAERHWLASEFFHAFNSELLSTVRTVEREVVSIFPVREVLSELDVVPNLRWIIPMALGHEKDHVRVYEVTEKEIF